MNYISKGTKKEEGKVVAEAEGIEFVFIDKERANLSDNDKKAIKEDFILIQKINLYKDRVFEGSLVSKAAYGHMMRQVTAIFKKWKEEKEKFAKEKL